MTPYLLSAFMVASICYEAHRRYCQSIGETNRHRPEWDALSVDEQGRLSAAVLSVDDKADPESNHVRWCKSLTDAGWVVGEVFDPVAKTHPSLVSYSELKEADVAKNHLFIGIVRSFRDAGVLAPFSPEVQS